VRAVTGPTRAGSAWFGACTLSCAAGMGLDEVARAIAGRRTGLRADGWHGGGPRLDTWTGPVPADLDDGWDPALAAWDSRNNRLAWAALGRDGFRSAVARAHGRHGAGRVALVLGTSTSSIGRTEEAYRALSPAGELAPPFVQPGVHNPHSTAAFLAHVLGVRGPVMTVSTACSSSAKVLASATRWLHGGLADAVVVGGVDSLCLSTLHGFHALQLLSPGWCRPFDEARDGLNIGEAAALAIVTRDPPDDPRGRLLGCGESCDAHHMSSPHPEGLGAQLAMQAALRSAGLAATEVGYVNLHGTGTRVNDAVESRAVAAVLPPGVPVSSTKAWTGHTLGAAGFVEAVLTLEALRTGLLPGTLNLSAPGADIAYPVMTENRATRVDVALSNSFGFGGSNCVLALGRVP
jgi:3-oxoacyl-[acyl-carrier-protein] synthase-1